MKKLGERYRTALVTGASGGLGRAFADMLLDEGLRVWGTARDPGRIAARPGLETLRLDLADPASVAEAFAAADAASGGLDIVVNNAGYGLFGPFAGRDFADWRRQVDAMLTQTMQLAHLALPGMGRRGRGALVNVASMAAEFPLPFMSGYNAVKAGMAGFSESLMVEVAGSGVLIIDFRPGDYRTGFNDTMQREPGHLSTQEPEAVRRRRVWGVLDANLRAAPPPERAAADLRRALRRGRSCTVRSGGFFQAGLAPWLARFAPLRLRRAVAARYFGSY